MANTIRPLSIRPGHVVVTCEWVGFGIGQWCPWAVEAGGGPGAEEAWAGDVGFYQQQILVGAVHFVHVCGFEQVIRTAVVTHHFGIAREVREVADGGFRHVQHAVVAREVEVTMGVVTDDPEVQ